MQPQDTIPRGHVILTCEYCGTTFTRHAAWVRNGRGRFCSRACLAEGRRAKVAQVCEQCGVEFQRHVSDVRRMQGQHTYCSTTCGYQARRSPLPRMAVYAIVHRASGRLYIGATSNLVRRWGSHRWKLGNGSHENTVLQAAWTREGATAFEFRVLEAIGDPTQLQAREQVWLDRHQGAEPAHGFNRNPSTVSARGRVQLPEVVEHVAAANRGKKHSAETRAKMSAAAYRRYHASDPALADERVTMVQLQFP